MYRVYSTQEKYHVHVPLPQISKAKNITKVLPLHRYNQALPLQEVVVFWISGIHDDL